MSTNWYYVEGTERVGPLTEEALKSLFDSCKLNQESYVWSKGQTDWSKIKEVPPLKYFYEEDSLSKEPTSETSSVDETQDESANDIFQVEEEIIVDNEPSTTVDEIPFIDLGPLNITGIDWNTIDREERKFTIKIGIDRGGDESEYGPFSISQICKAFEQKRINAKSLLFAPGMADWTFLADIPIYQEIFQELPPSIEEDDRRKNMRKPFVARMLFHDNEQLFEGICRDISVGGMQILISGYSGKVGEEVNMNVHPENSDFVFVASGKIVRILDGNQGFSIRFGNLGSQAKDSISNYLQQA
ncbi:MAG: DUF4339 domain-containing protein [Bacteriovoracaceae bacterium]|jgi:hypothetical protein|nr:DUF4339 domain-containing protein [Bacteriovoracaceae bacterium]